MSQRNTGISVKFYGSPSFYPNNQDWSFFFYQYDNATQGASDFASIRELSFRDDGYGGGGGGGGGCGGGGSGSSTIRRGDGGEAGGESCKGHLSLTNIHHLHNPNNQMRTDLDPQSKILLGIDTNCCKEKVKRKFILGHFPLLSLNGSSKKTSGSCSLKRFLNHFILFLLWDSLSIPNAEKETSQL